MNHSRSKLRPRFLSIALLLVLAAAACADDADSAEPEQRSPDAGRATPGEAGSAAAAADIPELNGCAADDYDDRSDDGDERVIAIAKMGLTFTPKCMTVAVGQRVRWEGNLGAHPLAPGNPDDLEAGSADNPIAATTSGQGVEFAFERAGTFPYHCTLHAFGAGQGMAGVVHVR